MYKIAEKYRLKFRFVSFCILRLNFRSQAHFSGKSGGAAVGGLQAAIQGLDKAVMHRHGDRQQGNALDQEIDQALSRQSPPLDQIPDKGKYTELQEVNLGTQGTQLRQPRRRQQP